jgi:hypothetical protein
MQKHVCRDTRGTKVALKVEFADVTTIASLFGPLLSLRREDLLSTWDLLKYRRRGERTARTVQRNHWKRSRFEHSANEPDKADLVSGTQAIRKQLHTVGQSVWVVSDALLSDVGEAEHGFVDVSHVGHEEAEHLALYAHQVLPSAIVAGAADRVRKQVEMVLLDDPTKA